MSSADGGPRLTGRWKGFRRALPSKKRPQLSAKGGIRTTRRRRSISDFAVSGQIPLNAALKVELKEAHPNDGTVPLPRRLGLTARAIPVGAGPPGLRRSRVRLG